MCIVIASPLAEISAEPQGRDRNNTHQSGGRHNGAGNGGPRQSSQRSNSGSRTDNATRSNQGQRPGAGAGMNQGRPGNGSNINPSRPGKPDGSGVTNNNNGNRPGGNQGQRPGNNIGNNNANPNRPGSGVTKPGNNQGNRPGNNQGNRPGNNFGPGNNNQQPGHNQQPGRPGPGHQGPSYGHRPPMLQPPLRPHRPVSSPWYRPMPPMAWRPAPGAPVLRTILGITLGTAINISLDYLYNHGFAVDGYGNNVIYLRDVSQFNCFWPDATLYYDNGRLAGSEFIYSTFGWDMSRYNRVFNGLMRQYGNPFSITRPNGGYLATWFGYNNGYISLEYSPRITNDGSTRFFTVLSFGN